MAAASLVATQGAGRVWGSRATWGPRSHTEPSGATLLPIAFPPGTSSGPDQPAGLGHERCSWRSAGGWPAVAVGVSSPSPGRSERALSESLSVALGGPCGCGAGGHARGPQLTVTPRCHGDATRADEPRRLLTIHSRPDALDGPALVRDRPSPCATRASALEARVGGRDVAHAGTAPRVASIRHHESLLVQEQPFIIEAGRIASPKSEGPR